MKFFRSFNKKNLKGLLRDIVIFAVVIVGITAWQSRNLLDADGSVQVDDNRLVSMQGEVESLTEPGKRTLVYFFAPWCNVCALSIGNLDHLASDDLNVVRVALDYQDKSEVARFMSDNDVQGRVLLGTEGVKQKFQVRGYPTYYLLDQDNKVVASSFGYSTSLGLKLTNYLNRG